MQRNKKKNVEREGAQRGKSRLLQEEDSNLISTSTGRCAAISCGISFLPHLVLLSLGAPFLE